MKRNEIVSLLVKEGLSEKTLVNMSDKHLADLAERMLGESTTTNIQQTKFSSSEVNNMKQQGQGLKADGTVTLNKDGGITVTKAPGQNESSSDDTDQTDLSEEKPSAGLSKEKKSEVVKKAKKGGDIGKKGKGFEKLADKAAKEYGSKEKGEKVAAAAMWKNVHNEENETKKWVKSLVENKYFHNFTSKSEIMELINTKLTEQTAPSKPKEKPGTDAPVREKPTTRPERPGRENPFEPKHNPKPKAKKNNLPAELTFNNIGIKFRDSK